jgi:hypothetical protein
MDNQGKKKGKDLLIEESPMVVLPSLAQKFGLREAIILQQVHYWLCTKLKNTDKHTRTIIDGTPWVYNSYPDWQKQFCWWSVDTVERGFISLEKRGLLKSATYNKMKMDRTKWYTIDYAKLAQIL